MDIRNRICDKIQPRIYADIEKQEDEKGRKYIKISAKGDYIPYSFDGRYYIRNFISRWTSNKWNTKKNVSFHRSRYY